MTNKHMKRLWTSAAREMQLHTYYIDQLIMMWKKWSSPTAGGRVNFPIILENNLAVFQLSKHLFYDPAFRLLDITQFSSVQFSSSVVSDSLQPNGLQHTRLPCLSPEFAQIQVHQVCDVIQPSHPLPSPSPPALNLSQYQSLFQWVSSSHQVAKVLEFQLQHQSFQ